jgi:GH25 family lysozyme M1 (1,4-beta-N-acetylmuramidase)
MMELPEPLTAASAQGEDRSSYQAVGSWSADAFGFAKATESDNYTDPTFARNWAALKAEGKIRGAYHFFHPSVPAAAQSALFVKTVKAQGLEPGDILVVDSEITSGGEGRLAKLVLSTPQAATRCAIPIDQPFLVPTAALVNTTTLAFCEQVAAAVGPHNPVLIYTNESVAHQLTSCAHYGLWIAYPSSVAPTAISPWKTWKFWQWAYGGGQGGGDRDAYNGTPAQLKAWIDTYLPAPDPPVPALGEDMPSGNVLVGTPPVCVVIPSGAKTLTLYCDHVTAALHASVRVAILHGGVYAISAAEIVSADKVYTVALPAGATAVSLAREDTNTSLAPGYYVG